MNNKAIEELISAYIDDELSEQEREKVKKLIKSDSRWDAEYKAMKKTASLLSRIEKIAVPEDLARRVSTSIALSKTEREKKRDSKFSLNLPRSPLFQYLATVVALGLIVLSGSYFLMMQKNQREKDYTLAMQKEKEWMDRQVAQQDQELLKQGYRWYFLRLEEDGSFKIIHIGESEPKPNLEAAPEGSVITERKSEKLDYSRRGGQVPGAAAVTAPDVAKSTAPPPVENKEIAEAEEKGKVPQDIKDNFAAAAPKKTAEDTDKLKEEVVVSAVEETRKTDSRSSLQAKASATKDAKAGAAKTESQKPPQQIGKNTDDSLIDEKDSYKAPAGKRFRSKDRISIGSLELRDEEKFLGDTRQVPVPPQPEFIPIIPVKHDGLIKNRIVEARLEITADGTVSNVEIISGSGNGWLDSAVRKALMKARFTKPEITGPEGTVKFDLKIEIK